MKRGWYKESYRHYLAAKGVSTSKYHKRGFFADQETVPVPSQFNLTKESETITKTTPDKPLTPATQRKYQTSEAQVESAIEAQTRAKRPIEQALADIDQGIYGTAFEMLRRPHSSEEEMAIKSALNAKAIQLANAGLPVPDQVRVNTDKAVQRRVALIAQQQARETESPLVTEARKKAPQLVGELLEAPGEGIALSAEELRKAGNAPGIETRTEELGESPFRKTNVAIGNEEDGFLSPLGFFPNGEVPSLGGSYDWAAPGDTNVLTKKSSARKMATELVQKQVDSLYDNKNDLAEVNLKSFDMGEKAFKKGDREALIDAILDLQAQEGKLRDRWRLVNQTQANVLSRENHEAAFQDDGNVILGSSRGGERLVDQTKKINEIKEDIIKANNEAFSRRRMLQYKLQRLDAKVPPETDVPEKITTFKEHETGKYDYLHVDNPVTARKDA